MIKYQSSFINQWVQIHDNDAGARYIELALDFKAGLSPSKTFVLFASMKAL